MPYIDDMYSDQLMMRDGKALAVKLYSVWRKLDKPTDLVSTSEIEVGDDFELAKPYEEMPAGQRFRFVGIVCGKMKFQLPDGTCFTSGRKITHRDGEAEDYDGRKMGYREYRFHGNPLLAIESKHYWWHIFYSLDKRGAVVAQLAHSIGQTVDDDYVNYDRCPKPGNVYELGYRFGEFPAGSKITYLGTDGQQLILLGPDGVEFKNLCTYKHYTRVTDLGFRVSAGGKFEGQHIVITDQVEYPNGGWWTQISEWEMCDIIAKQSGLDGWEHMVSLIYQHRLEKEEKFFLEVRHAVGEEKGTIRSDNEAARLLGMTVPELIAEEKRIWDKIEKIVHSGGRQ